MCDTCEGVAQFRRAIRPIEELLARKNKYIANLQHEIDSTLVLLSERGYDVNMDERTTLYSAVEKLLDDLEASKQ